ncbi:MAG: hypothetical protein B6U97_03275 [Candidatus Altiarchaeales archaeon ex4484_96]|nr:MAG: hypothetical protein B6U97_03275 [Candidatus Altiarchaeales archaeon ex4484_96]
MDGPEFDNMMKDMFWKDIIYEIISQMNPWDIDIAHLASRYAKRVDEMDKDDFKIPANVIIVSSVLLRMKADIIASINFNPDDYRDDKVDEIDFISFSDFDPELFAEGHQDMNAEMVDWQAVSLAVKPKRVPKRKVTAFELISAIQEVLEDKKIREYRKVSKKETKIIEVEINRDMGKIIEETYLRIMDILSNKNMVLFSEITDNRDEVISTLISLLHLSNKQKVKLKQEKLFDEIFIKAA